MSHHTDLLFTILLISPSQPQLSRAQHYNNPEVPRTGAPCSVHILCFKEKQIIIWTCYLLQEQQIIKKTVFLKAHLFYYEYLDSLGIYPSTRNNRSSQYPGTPFSSLCKKYCRGATGYSPGLSGEVTFYQVLKHMKATNIELKAVRSSSCYAALTGS